MKTRNGIYYDLNHSKYKITVDGLTFVFSSQLHLKKFTERQQPNRLTINKSLSKRFNICVEFNALADVVLYKKIETRGFLIIDNEGKKLCQNSIKCGGVKVIPLNSSAL